MTRRKGLPLIDVFPEHFPYRDDGCDISPSCLNCPLPHCKYDEPGWLQRETRQRRDQEVMMARIMEGKTVPQLARIFGLSERTIHRIIKRINGH